MDNIYFQKIRNFKLLTAEQELELLKKFKQGDQSALNRLIVSNLRLVINIAKKYCKNGNDINDLIQEGNLGLITAIEKFDVEKGTRLSTYATFWIKRSILNAVSENRIVRLPTYIQEMINKVLQVESELEQSLGRVATIVEISEKAELDIDKVTNVYKIITQQSEDIDKVKCFCSSPLEDALDYDRCETLKQALNILSEREKNILMLRFGIGCEFHTLEQISNIYGITRERIRQLESKALEKLKKSYKAEKFREYRVA